MLPLDSIKSLASETPRFAWKNVLKKISGGNQAVVFAAARKTQERRMTEPFHLAIKQGAP
jgi:hypothetical protein